MKDYEHYKSGTNSRGLTSRDNVPPAVTNSGFTLNQQFRDACERASKELVGVAGSHKKNRKTRKLRSQRGKNAWEAGLQKEVIAPTKRQASRYKMKCGAAWAAHLLPIPSSLDIQE